MECRLNLQETFEKCEFNHADYVLTVHFTSGLYMTGCMRMSGAGGAGVSIYSHNHNTFYNMHYPEEENVVVVETLTSLLALLHTVTAVKVQCVRERDLNHAQIIFYGDTDVVEITFYHNNGSHDSHIIFEQRHWGDNLCRNVLLEGFI